MNNSLKKLLTVKDVMPLWGVSRSWLYDAAARGILPAIRIGGRLRFDPDALQAWLEKQNQTPGKVIDFKPPAGRR